MFEVGDKVCVVGEPIKGWRKPPKGVAVPKRGIVYTVSDGRMCVTEWGINLSECPAPSGDMWLAKRFRKLRDNERQAHETWREMLSNPMKIREDIDA